MKRLTNPTQHLFNAWLNWFVENEMIKLEVVCHSNRIITDGFKDQLRTQFIRLNISAAATRNFQVDAEGVSFECGQNGKPVNVRLPWASFVSFEGQTVGGQGFGVPFGNLEINQMESPNLSEYDAGADQHVKKTVELKTEFKKPTLKVVK